VKSDIPTDVDDLLKKLRAEIAGRSTALVRGAPADYAAYQNLVGVLSGLTLAEQLVIALLEHMDDRDFDT
jgi:hypothetical protein